MNLEDLTVKEQELIWKVESVTGFMEEKHEQLENLGVYTEYAKVHQSYAALFSSNEQDLEPLKRAVFLSWYQFAEPTCFSGLWSLSEQTTRFICETLDRIIQNEALDLELKWMLAFYNSVFDLPFSLYPELNHLQSFLKTANSDLWRKEIKPNDLSLRGQMGNYWLTIFEESSTTYLNAG